MENSKLIFKKIDSDLIFLNKHLLINLDDVICFVALSNYTTIHLITGKKIVVAKTLKNFEQSIPLNETIRIHRSYLVNKKHILTNTFFNKTKLELSNGFSVPISRRMYKNILSA